jgi:hypothetical protein
MKTNSHIFRVTALLLCSFAAVTLLMNFSWHRTPAIPKTTPFAGPHATGLSVTAHRERREAAREYGKLPLSFEANRGQTDARVKFLSRAGGYQLFLTSTEAVLALRAPRAKARNDSRGLARNPRAEAPVFSKRDNLSDVLRMHFVGANAATQVFGVDELPGKSNYFIGNDPRKWRAGIPTYAKVKYRGVYPGIDLVFYGDRRQLEHDFVVAPGADPAAIALAFDGAENVKINDQGDLVLCSSEGEVRLHKPQIYQEGNGGREAVAGHYIVKADGRVGFKVAQYDGARPLVIDPVLSYSTYLGGTNGDDFGNAIAVVTVAGTTSAYVAGETFSTNFPTMPLANAPGGPSDSFVTKLNAAGTALVYSTYLGGNGTDRAFGIALDSLGNAYVTGDTDSTDFPVSTNPFQPTPGGGKDAFLSKLDPNGANLLYSTYFGKSGTEHSFGIAVESPGKAYITGDTDSTNLAIVNGFQTVLSASIDGFVAKFDTTMQGTSSLLYSTYLGGTGNDEGNGIAVDTAGHAYVAGDTSSTDFPHTTGAFQTSFQGGTDAFITKIDTAQTGNGSLVYSSYLGGPTADVAFAIALDTASPPNAYVAGSTDSIAFPTTTGAFQAAPARPGAVQAFVTKLNGAGTALVYSTFLGGSTSTASPIPQGAADFSWAIAVDSAGNAYTAGQTTSPTDFPLFRPFQAANAGGTDDAFITKLDPTGALLVYSSYLGGSGADHGFAMALDGANPPNAYVTGDTNSTNFTTTTGAFQTTSQGGFDAFVTKIDDSVSDFAITAPDGSLNLSQTVARGTTATYNMKVAAFNGFTGMTTITCAGAPALTTCNPPASAVAAGPFTLTVNTTPHAAVPPSWPNLLWPLSLRPWTALAAVLGILFLVAAHFRARRWKPQLAAPMGLVFVCLLSLVIWGCTGGHGGGGGGGGGGGTIPGDYTLTVTGTSGTLPSRSMTIKLKVTE